MLSSSPSPSPTAPRFDPSEGDPFARLFFDQVTSAGIRIVAVAEPLHRTMHGYLTASAALAAFEEALAVAVNGGAEPGLLRAFAASNQAVRDANRLTVADQRAFAGITAVVVDGQSAVIAIVSPGQALLIQDRRLYGIPDLTTWSPTYMPGAGVSGQEPLGVRMSVRPHFRRTTLREGDRLLLGASAVGRVLASHEVLPLADSPDVAVAEELERAMEAAGASDAYAAWIRFDRDPAAPPKRTQRMHEIDRIWKGHGPQSHVPVILPADPPAERGSDTARYRIHTHLIEASERVFGRKKPEELPYESVRRSDVPYCPQNGGRYRPSRHPRPNLLTWLPRGLRPPISRRESIALLLAFALACSALYGWNVHFARAVVSQDGDRFLGNARTELAQAENAADPTERSAHLVAAERALNEAINHGAKPDELAPLQHAVATAEDAFSGTGRLTAVTKLVALPAPAGRAGPRLFFAGGHLYLVDGGVYLVGQNAANPQPLLTPGRRTDGVKVGTIVDAAVDGGELVVSDGSTLFRLREDDAWSASPLPDAHGSWSGKAAGAFKGSFYLLDPDAEQIVKFSRGASDTAPANWLAQPEPSLANAIDMEIDGSVHVLLADGTIATYYKGEATGSVSVAGQSHLGSFVALAPSATEGVVYAVEIEGGVATLVRVDLASGVTARMSALTSWHAGYDAAATQAFGETVDFAIDEATNTLYFVTGSAVWTATLPAAS